MAHLSSGEGAASLRVSEPEPGTRTEPRAKVTAIAYVRHENNAVVRVDYVNGVDAADGLSTSVRSFDLPGLAIQTTPGYDNVTGLGTPAGAAFLRALG